MNTPLLKLVAISLLFSTTMLQAVPKICIIIPAYNEEHRIEKMLTTYLNYFEQQKKSIKTTFIISANNCSDKTVTICKQIQKTHPNLEILDLKPGGKGFALKQGYLHALNKPYDYIGFVDADMATLPEYFHDLIKMAHGYDGAIASRYAPGANVWPKRTAFRIVTGKIFNWVLKKQFKIPFNDTQCGAKLFTYQTIKSVAPKLKEVGWNCDLEILYLCQQENKKIKEVPTTWSDQPGSHLQLSGKLIKDFLAAPSRIKKNHRPAQATKKRKTQSHRKSKRSKQRQFK